MKNKRKEKRFVEENKVIVQHGFDSKDSNNFVGINGLTYDISLGGARVLTNRFFLNGTVIRIQIDLVKSRQVIKVDGKVIWVKSMNDDNVFEIGVEFLHKISKTVLFLIAHLYGEDEKVPSTVSTV